MAAFSQKLSPGKFHLLNIDAKARVETSAGTKAARVKGEVVISLHGDHPQFRGLQIQRLSLAGTSVEGKRGPTGVFTIIGEPSRGEVRLSKERLALSAQIPAQLNYLSLDRARVKDMDRACYYIPATEPASVRITGTLVERADELLLAGAQIIMVGSRHDFGEIVHVILDLEAVQLHSIRPLGGKYEPRFTQDESGNTVYDPCIQVNTRQMTVQPVGFKSSAADPNPTGGTAAAQLAEAQVVWGKSCINFSIKPTVFIEDSTLKTSSDLAAIRAAYDDSDPTVIEVFFVANPLSATGGGNAGAIGMASCKPVIAEPNSGNTVLTAHELGHCLGLYHPGSGTMNSDPGTVMQPTNSASIQGTELVTYFMTQNIATPVLQTLAAMCCLSHDKGDHFIRDFPVDVGSEPSDPLPAGMTRYSMSNVWNRLTDTPGTWNAMTGPEHESPARYDSTMTPVTNYLYAIVEQRNNLPVRNPAVRFYLKTPGSGGGAANLQFLGQVPVPSTLALGTQEILRLPWTVPSGTPAHSCAFAVVSSPEEPEGTQSGLSWAQFEDLAHQDNDWAQRNLDIQDILANAGGDSNRVESAPFSIQIPAGKEREQLSVLLEVDARHARGLKAVWIEVAGEELQVPPGKTAELRPKAPLVPGREYAVVIGALIPAGVPPGRSFTVLVNPIVEKSRLVGFGERFRVARRRDAIAQSLDRILSAFRDFAQAAEIDVADEWERSAEEIFLSARKSPEALASALIRQLYLADHDQVIRSFPQAVAFGVPEAVVRYAKAADAFRTGSGSAAAVIETFRSVAQRLGMAASTMLREAKREFVVAERTEEHAEDLVS